MHKFIYVICIIAVLSSCSNISEDERFIYVKPAEVSRNVLLEDYTGQLCVNCPKAADEIYKLQQLYGEEHVIAVAIHGGPSAMFSNANFEGLRTELGDEYYSAAKIEVNPMGMINRQGNAVTPERWQSLVNERIQQTASVALSIHCEHDGNKIHVTTSAIGVDGKTAGKLQLWVLEDGIVGAQMMPDGSANTKYLHNHVLRTAINGAWGEDFDIEEGEAKNFSHFLDIDTRWNLTNLSIVAFVYNNQGVQQIEKKPVVSNE